MVPGLRAKEAAMKCVICKHGKTRAGTTTVTLERDGMTLVFKHVPAEICTNCGEAFIAEETGRQLIDVAEGAAQAGVEVDIRAFVAVDS
jgi:YgiT-type zinc finger domain-containing protein